MNLKKIDNRTLKTAGAVALAAGLLYYPATRLYKYLKTKRANSNMDNNEETTVKSFAPSYRAKHKPHHRHAAQSNHNGSLV